MLSGLKVIKKGNCVTLHFRQFVQSEQLTHLIAK